MTHAPRVFAVQRPTVRDPSTGTSRTSMDLSPAEDFGELRFLLRSSLNPFDDLTATAGAVRDALTGALFGPEDYLLLVGNPALIGVVAAVAAGLTGGRLRMLQWNRLAQQYYPLEAQLTTIVDHPITA